MAAYHENIIKANKAADQSLLGVQLGRLCIWNEIPILKLTNELGVSRVRLYKWFKGIEEVGHPFRERVKAYYDSIPRAGAFPWRTPPAAPR